MENRSSTTTRTTTTTTTTTVPCRTMFNWKHNCYIEDITWSRGDTFIFEWNIFQHEKINVVSPSGNVVFCLLYRHRWNKRIIRHFPSLPCVPYHRAKHGFGFFICFIITYFLTFVKKLALICKKTSFFHSLQERARKVFSRAGKGFSFQLAFSLPARAEWRHGLLRASVLW